ncbi:MAG: ATP synthase F1 subunit gamma [Gemmataceae bacterium]
MASTRVLVKRRKAVRNIRKITRTMELIATARFKKAMDRAAEAETYTRKIAELVGEVAATASNITHPLLKPHAELKKAVVLVLGSNRGLCGGYNAGILREALAGIRRLTDQKATIQLELSGKRVISFFKYTGMTPTHTYTQFEDKPTSAEVYPIAERYIQEYIDGTIDRVEVAYMRFLSASVQRPVIETLLPFHVGGLASADNLPKTSLPEQDRKKRKIEYEFIPSAEEILEQLLPESFKARLFKSFLDAAVSEQIARRVTMKQATENAGEMIKSLTQEYNRARQAGITKEILEIVSGAEALK